MRNWILVLLALLISSAAARAQATAVPGAASLRAASAPDPGSNMQESGAGTAERQESQSTRFKASSFVPLDSWIYATFDRLIAMGYVQTGSVMVRPWTRLECARLLAEAHENSDEYGQAPLALLAALDSEFAPEIAAIDGGTNRDMELESVYSRFTGIVGTPLRDAFHFGQSLEDDYGRPYGPGGNEVSGISVRGGWEAFSFYLRGEHQYAEAMPVYNTAAQQAIVASDSMYLQGSLPFGWNLRNGTTDRLRLIEAYGSVNFANWQISLGQQSLWWGPDRSTSLILSNNAEAMPMLRFTRVKPAKMPEKMAWVGPVHFDAFFAREGGIHYVALGPAFSLFGSPSHALTPPPYLWGVIFSFEPSQDFEIGFAHTVIFAGYGRPLNLKTFFHTFSINGNGQAVDPGKRVTEFNLSYHPPGFRRSLVAYTEGMAWDDPVEGKFVARFAMDPGIYIPQLPVLKKVDLRMEGAYTDLPKLVEPAYYYANAHYVEGYTNYGQILGSWIGRQGRGGQISSSYWFTARDKATLSYRRMTVDKAYLEGGGMSDISGKLSWLIRPDIELTTNLQYERWNFPLLGTDKRTDFSSGFELKLFPKLHLGIDSKRSFMP